MSTLISRTNAALYLVAGLALLFAPDAVLAWLAPGFPASALWLGQLLAAAWLGLAALNWLSRRLVLGGIYGRPVVFANLLATFVGAASVLRAAQRAGLPPGLLAVGLVLAALALAHGLLLLRGPFAGDRERPGEAA